MVDFHNPTVIANEYLVLTKLDHIMGGFYIWEFFTTLDYEWSVICGYRPYRWTIWIYSFTRVATLMSIILSLVAVNITSPINCQAWVTSTFVFSYLALSAASLVIVLRTMAIWNKKKVVVILATCMWCIYFTFLIEGITQLRSTWRPGNRDCAPPNIESNKLAIIAMFVADILLLLTMLLGLHRLRDRAGGMFGLAHLLWKQGVIWLLIATGSGLTTVAFLCLDLNPLLDVMFLLPTLITISMTATRMYTSLADSSSSADLVKGSDLQGGLTHRTIVPSAEHLLKVPVTYEQHTTVTTNECVAV